MNLLAARKRAKKTQSEAAEHFGVSVGAISQWENGLTNPRIALLPKIAEFYGVTVDELLKEGANDNG